MSTTRARLRAAVVASGAVGLLAGALVLGGNGLAAADPPTFVEADLIEANGVEGLPEPSPLNQPSYAKTDDGFVHLRGIVGAPEAEMVKLPDFDPGGPWVVHAFTLPCGFRPERIDSVPVTINDITNGGGTAWHGIALVQPDGDVYVGAFDIPVTPDGVGGHTASFALNLMGSFYADNDEVCPEPTTTTTEEPTTTTEEP
jgi:hypothetical protein